MNELVQVPFHGRTLLANRGATAAETLVPLRPVVVGMGLDWVGQRQRIMRHPVLRATVCVTHSVGEDGKRREMVSLPLDRVNFWLATIDTTRIPDQEKRARIVVYQTECADVLFRHFFGAAEARVEGPDSAPEPEDVGPLAEARLKLQLVDMARVLRGPPAALALWRRLGLPWVAEMEDVAPAGLAGGQSALDAFLSACVRPDAGGRVQSSVLHRAYCAWAAAVGAPPMTAAAMGRALKARGVEKLQSNVIWWIGITLAVPEDLAEARH